MTTTTDMAPDLLDMPDISLTASDLYRKWIALNLIDTDGSTGCQFLMKRRLGEGRRAASGNGYVLVDAANEKTYAHVVAFTAANGRPPMPDMEVAHTCADLAHESGTCADTSSTCPHRACINPDHLSEMTHRDNVLAGTSVVAELAKRTHCPRGHALTPDNVPECRAAKGHRQCLTCARELSREHSRLVLSAARALGLKRDDYAAKYGRSKSAALAVLSDVEALA